MYRLLIRPLFFLLPPERAHSLVSGMVKLLCALPGGATLLKMLFSRTHPSLEVEFAGLVFKNPVGLAAGFDKNASSYNSFFNFGFSFIEIGTVTPRAQPGNPRPRSFRLPKDQALINRMGFNNLGVDHAVGLLQKRKPGNIVGGNIGKNTTTPNERAVDDYEYCFRKLYPYVDYFVVNVSCQNITDLRELQDQGALTAILARLVEIRRDMEVRKPILLKISPDLNNGQLDEVIDIYHRTGIDGLVATNTTIRRDNLHTPAARIRSAGNGGLSGKPLRDDSTRIIRYISEKSDGKIPIIGVGGIMTPHDAKEKLDAGARLVQVYTGFIYEGPAIVKKINKYLAKN